MSIQTIAKTFFAVSLLSIALAGVGWAGDTEQKDADETASVDAAPPAAAAEEEAKAEKAETAETDKTEDTSD